MWRLARAAEMEAHGASIDFMAQTRAREVALRQIAKEWNMEDHGGLEFKDWAMLRLRNGRYLYKKSREESLVLFFGGFPIVGFAPGDNYPAAVDLLAVELPQGFSSAEEAR